jgi:molybdopterin synthase sulfur carrier subunit
MKVKIKLFGALREADPAGQIEVEIASGSTIADLREQVTTHLASHAPAISAGLVKRSAFASESEVLHEDRSVPESGTLALLPPVSGG